MKTAIQKRPAANGRFSFVQQHCNGAPTDAAMERSELLHELFEAQADVRPGSVAVECNGARLTYSDLDARANQLARHLAELGVRRGTYVALLLERSAEVYIAMLAAMKAGAAYVPIDPGCPAERIKYILTDCDAQVVVTTSSLKNQCGGSRAEIVCLDREREDIAAQSAERLSALETGVTPEDVCYLIYTSGSTGRPKGVQIEHCNVCNFVRAEGEFFQVGPADRVYQGLSVAFDASVEEIWLAFFAGATLVVAPREIAHSGPDLARDLRAARITVVSTVPTLWSMVEEDVPTLRLLIFGGESCPAHLVKRWWSPARRVVNTYGPTEATVVATATDLHPDRPVTIGRPLENCRVYVLDEALQPVPPGEAGELCIGGAGVARGYLGQPELTREKFIPNPFVTNGEPARLYRTGDLARWTADGQLEFLGRLDSQVKLRGYRIELAEIESVLLENPEVRAAAVAVREDTPGLQQLVGYLVPHRQAQPDLGRLRTALRTRLPAYMIPALFETLPDLPTLPSGKVDRKALPRPQTIKISGQRNGSDARTPLEQTLLACWEKLFAPTPVSVQDDFFLDLGGHSLLAARMVSEMRKEARCRDVSVRDVYEFPTIKALAARLTSASSTGAARPTVKESRPHRQPSVSAHFWCGVLQAASFYFVFGFRALLWITPYLVYFLLLAADFSPLASVAWATVSAVTAFPLAVLIAVAVKWLVLGRVRPGRWQLWGGYYLRWWFVQTLVAALHLTCLAGTPLLPFVYRLFGARIGKDVYIGTDDLAAFDLTSIGDGTSVDDEASLLGQTVEDGELVIGPVTIGRRCFVGTRSVLREYTVLEDGARVEDLSLLPRNTRVPAGETWAGSPARRVAAPPSPAPSPVRGPIRRCLTAALYAVLALLMPLAALVPFIPGVAVLTHIDMLTQPLLFLGASVLVGGIFVLLLTAEVVALKWLLVGRVRAGTYPLHGNFYIRNWIVDRLLALSLAHAGQLHATLYLPPWYRALGAKLGRLVELSTASSTTPDLLEIGDGGTVADEVSLGAARIEGGWMTVSMTRLGERAFIGNSGVVPSGTTLGDRSLVGVLSITPPNAEAAAQPDTSWLGSPPIQLPRREPSAGFVEARTYCPARWLVLTRAFVEIFRVTLPPAGFIFVVSGVITATLAFWDRFGLGIALALLPLVYTGCCAVVIAAVAAAKWLVIGRYRPFVRPLWSQTIWRLEFVNALYEFLATPLALEALQGTPLLPWYFRLLGARVGRQVYSHTTGLLEWDLVEIGDRVILNDDSVLQTHLFEDRVLKAAGLRIGSDCSVGALSVVLYDSVMEDGAWLGDLSLLMKGEVLPAGTRWEGSPAHCVEATPRPVLHRGRNRASRRKQGRQRRGRVTMAKGLSRRGNAASNDASAGTAHPRLVTTNGEGEPCNRG